MVVLQKQNKLPWWLWQCAETQSLYLNSFQCDARRRRKHYRLLKRGMPSSSSHIVGNVLKSWQIAREGGDAWAGLQELWQHETSTFLAWLYRCHTTNSSINAGCCSRAKWNTSAHSKIREIFSLFFMNNQAAAAVKGGIKEKLCQHPKLVCALCTHLRSRHHDFALLAHTVIHAYIGKYDLLLLMYCTFT